MLGCFLFPLLGIFRTCLESFSLLGKVNMAIDVNISIPEITTRPENIIDFIIIHSLIQSTIQVETQTWKWLLKIKVCTRETEFREEVISQSLAGPGEWKEMKEKFGRLIGYPVIGYSNEAVRTKQKTEGLSDTSFGRSLKRCMKNENEKEIFFYYLRENNNKIFFKLRKRA